MLAQAGFQLLHFWKIISQETYSIKSYCVGLIQNSRKREVRLSAQ